jgi:hypothetical protein
MSWLATCKKVLEVIHEWMRLLMDGKDILMHQLCEEQTATTLI